MAREGWKINHKRVYRLYKEENLQIARKKSSRRVKTRPRNSKVDVVRPNQCWSMDFMSDQLFDGKRFRILTAVDNYTRVCPILKAGYHYRAVDVVASLSEIEEEYGLPERICLDNGPEFISKELDLWAYTKGVALEFSRPGKPTDNAYIESFNSRFRDECLNQHWFLNLDDVRSKLDAWRVDYNEERPHSSIGNVSPMQYYTEYIKQGA